MIISRAVAYDETAAFSTRRPVARASTCANVSCCSTPHPMACESPRTMTSGPVSAASSSRSPSRFAEYVFVNSRFANVHVPGLSVYVTSGS